MIVRAAGIVGIGESGIAVAAKPGFDVGAGATGAGEIVGCAWTLENNFAALKTPSPFVIGRPEDFGLASVGTRESGVTATARFAGTVAAMASPKFEAARVAAAWVAVGAVVANETASVVREAVKDVASKITEDSC